MNEANRHTVTAALPYANGPLHIGHIAGAYLPADIYVRSLRQRGKDVLFVCGSDEHGAAITIKALKEGTTPKAIVDKYHGMIRDAFAEFGIAFDIYHRTSSELHKETSQAFFLELYRQDAFTQKEELQYFDVQAGQFLADRYIMGTCPHCGNPDAYGDQCEKCGSALSPNDLIDPRSTLSGTTPEKRPTSHWYLPMERHQQWMETFLNEGTLDGKPHHNVKEWKPQVLGQCNSWLKDGLRPRAMTRDLDWGVPVPLPNAEGKVMYVWLDAPIGYISATKQWALDHGKDWKPWWQDKDTRLVHFIGKDNIVFHCIIFPILLQQHGGYLLPQNVPANEFLNLEGQKLSTSRNWAVWVHEYLERWPGRQDELRYCLNTILPEFRDSEFTWKDFQEKNNNELVAIIGNFVQRVFVLVNKYYDGRVPEPGYSTQEDADVVGEVSALPFGVADLIDKFRFRDALSHAMKGARIGNKYLTETEPWKLVKQDPSRVDTILYNCVNIVAKLTVLLDPFLPQTCNKLRAMLGVDQIEWQTYIPNFLKAGMKIGAAEHLFKPITDEEIAAEVERLKAAAPTVEPTPEDATNETPSRAMKPNITFEEFAKMDLRVGTIVAAQKVPKADKLLQLSVDVGEAGPRTVVSGIAQQFTPEQITGKQVVLLCNLEPRKMRGVESQGMVLMAEDAEGKLQFVRPDVVIDPGAEVR